MGKAKKKIKNKEVEYDGLTFDSVLERDFYKHLKQSEEVATITPQPEYELIPGFTVDCLGCLGKGRKPSPRTGNDIQCSSCRGTGESKRLPMVYTPDFLVSFTDGREEVVDVKGGYSKKGGFRDDAFPVRRKIFEYRYGKRLVVVMWKNGAWVKK